MNTRRAASSWSSATASPFCLDSFAFGLNEPSNGILCECVAAGACMKRSSPFSSEWKWLSLFVFLPEGGTWSSRPDFEVLSIATAERSPPSSLGDVWASVALPSSTPWLVGECVYEIVVGAGGGLVGVVPSVDRDALASLAFRR